MTERISLAGVKADDYASREAYKSIRTNVEFCGDDVKVIAITSCVSHEGKSSVSLNMAISFAEMGNKVLFLDTDLRKSMFALKFKISGSVPGMTHYLSGQKQLQDVILDTDIKNLQMIYAGATPPDPTELLGSRRFKELIERARREYDYVIIDTPPLGTVIDCAVISPVCDGAVILVAANEISYKFAYEVKMQLVRAKCRILGVILNKVDLSKSGYYSKYYGKKYGKYGNKYYSGYYSCGGENEPADGKTTDGK